MKIIKVLITFMVIPLFTFGQNETIKEQETKTINIKKVDFEIMTFKAVECNSFEQYFKDYVEFEVTDNEKIYTISNLLKEMNCIDSTYSKTIDVRAKLTFTYQNNKNEIICIGNLITDIGGTHYITPKELREFISNF